MSAYPTLGPSAHSTNGTCFLNGNTIFRIKEKQIQKKGLRIYPSPKLWTQEKSPSAQKYLSHEKAFVSELPSLTWRGKLTLSMLY